MGTGTIVIGLASVIIGEVLFGTRSFLRTGLFPWFSGSIVYRIVIAFSLRNGYASKTILKLFTAILVAYRPLFCLLSEANSLYMKQKGGTKMLEIVNLRKTFFHGTPNEKESSSRRQSASRRRRFRYSYRF